MVTDGTVVWWVKDSRCPYTLGQFVCKLGTPKPYEYLLLCDGSTISEENYPELVELLGGTQLPNLIDRFLQGAATAGTYKEAGLPNIEGDLGIANVGNYSHSGNYKKDALGYKLGVASGASYASGTNCVSITFDASNSNTIYGNSDTVQPPAYTTKIYICYAG